MKLISQIINDLIDNEKSVNGALLKTKVLASRIQNSELLNWVNNELNGYNDVDELPDYRDKISAHIQGTYLNGRTKYTNQAIPTLGLDKELEDSLVYTRFMESITSIENLLKIEDTEVLGIPIRAELIHIIGENWINMGNPYLQLISANKIISKNAIVSTISKVRNKLLDFMLEIDQQFGNETEISDLKQRKEEITNIMNKTIIKNTGDGNVINTGAKSKISASINITTGNKAELEKLLKENGVSDAETAELIEIIDDEEPNRQSGKFGKKVNAWTSKMLNKALNGSWNVGIGTAGNLLAEGIKAYYGM